MHHVPCDLAEGHLWARERQRLLGGLVLLLSDVTHAGARLSPCAIALAGIGSSSGQHIRRPLQRSRSRGGASRSHGFSRGPACTQRGAIWKAQAPARAQVISLDEVIAGVQRGWCQRIHPSASRTWLEIPDTTPLTQARGEWYDQLPRWNLTGLGPEAEGQPRLISGIQLDSETDERAPLYLDWQDPRFASLTCGPVRDVSAQLAKLLDPVAVAEEAKRM